LWGSGVGFRGKRGGERDGIYSDSMEWERQKQKRTTEGVGSTVGSRGREDEPSSRTPGEDKEEERRRGSKKDGGNE